MHLVKERNYRVLPAVTPLGETPLHPRYKAKHSRDSNRMAKAGIWHQNMLFPDYTD